MNEKSSLGLFVIHHLQKHIHSYTCKINLSPLISLPSPVTRTPEEAKLKYSSPQHRQISPLLPALYRETAGANLSTMVLLLRVSALVDLSPVVPPREGVWCDIPTKLLIVKEML